MRDEVGRKRAGVEAPGLERQLVHQADVAGRIVIWNRAATELYGWPADEVLGRPILGLLLAREVELDAVAVLASVASGQPWAASSSAGVERGPQSPFI